MTTRPVVVALGSNIEPEQNIPEALLRLKAQFEVQAEAPIYQTPPVDRPEQADFWNSAVMIRTELDLETVRSELRAIEQAHGRVRTADKSAARTLDLDILWADGEILDPDVATRPFLRWLLRDLGVTP